MTTGERIRNLRLSKGISQGELGELIGVQNAAIYKYEKGIITNIPKDKLYSLALALDTNTSYLSCLSNDSRPQDKQLELSSGFRKRVSKQLENLDSVDITNMFEGISQSNNLIDEKLILTLDDAYLIAFALGVSLDYLTGIVDDPKAKLVTLPDFSLEMAIEDADDELIQSVHRICGMFEMKIAEEVALGRLESTWNPKKIKLVQEFIEDSQAVLQKMLANIE